MTRPCAMDVIMGTRTVTPGDFGAESSEPSPALLAEMTKVDADAPSQGEIAAGGVSQRRFLSFLDERTSTATLGFRLDAAKTVVDGSLEPLPLPPGVTLSTLQSEVDVTAAISAFVQHDVPLANAFLLKLQTVAAALERSSFLPRHALLRTTILFIYDDAARETKLDVKLTEFAESYALPEGESITHTAPWDGSAASHEDGYLTGVRSLLKIVKKIASQDTNNESIKAAISGIFGRRASHSSAVLSASGSVDA